LSVTFHFQFLLLNCLNQDLPDSRIFRIINISGNNLRWAKKTAHPTISGNNLRWAKKTALPTKYSLI